MCEPMNEGGVALDLEYLRIFAYIPFEGLLFWIYSTYFSLYRIVLRFVYIFPGSLSLSSTNNLTQSQQILEDDCCFFFFLELFLKLIIFLVI